MGRSRLANGGGSAAAPASVNACNPPAQSAVRCLVGVSRHDSRFPVLKQYRVFYRVSSQPFAHRESASRSSHFAFPAPFMITESRKSAQVSNHI